MKFLNPDELKANLARASVYLCSYELLKSAVIGKPRWFFSPWYPRDGEDSPDYKAEVTALCPKDPFHASCLCLRKMNAIDDADVGWIERIRRHRNDIAHELPKYLIDPQFEVNMQLLDTIHFLVGKIERWWLREVEMLADPAVPDADIKSGITLAIELMHMIIHGQDAEWKQWFDAKRHATGNDPLGPTSKG
jgi:hypothetical protein